MLYLESLILLMGRNRQTCLHFSTCQDEKGESLWNVSSDQINAGNVLIIKLDLNQDNSIDCVSRMSLKIQNTRLLLCTEITACIKYKHDHVDVVIC
jgi:hypothetical protein